MTVVIGLTGSIGMGKSTTARMFEERDVPVFDSDRAVHALYSGRAAPLIGEAFPGTVRDGVVDRVRLSEAVVGDRDRLHRLESIVHPLVREEQDRFLDSARAAGADMVVLDIPLLFESGGDARVDKIVVVSCPPEIQKQRVLARPGMTEDKFESILARQVPDCEKRRRADFIVETGNGLAAASEQVDAILAMLRRRGN